MSGNAFDEEEAKRHMHTRIDELKEPDVRPNYTLEEVLIYVPVVFELVVVVIRQHIQCGVDIGEYGQPLTSYDWMAKHFPDGTIYDGPTALHIGLVTANCAYPEFLSGIVGDRTGRKEDHWLALVPFKKKRRTQQGIRNMLKPYLDAAKSRIDWVEQPVSIQFPPDQVLGVLQGLRKSSKDRNKVTLDTIAVQLNVDIQALSKIDAKNLVLATFCELNLAGLVQFPTSTIRSPFSMESMDLTFKDIDDKDALVRALHDCGLLVSEEEQHDLHLLRELLHRAYVQFMNGVVEVAFAKPQSAPILQMFSRHSDEIPNVIPDWNEYSDQANQDADGDDRADYYQAGHVDNQVDDESVNPLSSDLANMDHTVSQSETIERCVIARRKGDDDRHRIAIRCNNSTMPVSLLLREIKPVLAIAENTPCFVSVYDWKDNVWDLIDMNERLFLSLDRPVQLMLTPSHYAGASSFIKDCRSFESKQTSHTKDGVELASVSRRHGKRGHGEFLRVAMERVLEYRNFLAKGFGATSAAAEVGISPAALKIHDTWARVSDVIAARLNEPAVSWIAFNCPDGSPSQEWQRRWDTFRTGKNAQNALLQLMEPEEQDRFSKMAPKTILLELNGGQTVI